MPTESSPKALRAFVAALLLLNSSAALPQGSAAPPQQMPPQQQSSPQQQTAPQQQQAPPQNQPQRPATPRVVETPVSNASSPATAAERNQERNQDLNIIPAPRELARHEGEFVITPATRIVLNAKHAKEDRLAADAIAEEIKSAAKVTVHVTTGAAMPPAGAVIYLARVGDDHAAADRLKAQKLEVAANFDDQGYVISAEKGRVTVSARTGQGLFYGAQTLRQLIRPRPCTSESCKPAVIIPVVAIRDWPAMKWRGVHDDISRGPVPNLDFIKQQVRTEAEYKLNLHALYIEHTFTYANNPLIGPEEGSLTPAEIKEIVEYARRYYVTILPEQELFGHLHHVLKWEMYGDLAEMPHGHDLTPTNPKTYDFIKGLTGEMAPLFPAPFIHIGADETTELGKGRTKDLAQQEGLGRVYLEHLQKLETLLAPYHKRLMFWGDIAEKYPDLLNILPKSMIAVPWNYNPLPSFDRELAPFKNAGLETWVSPGANNWNQMWPNLDAAFINIRNFVRDGQKYGSVGMLNTTWDDDGEALFNMTWPAIVLGAAASWQPGECNLQRFLDSYDWAFYRNSQTHEFRDVLASLTRTHSILRGANAGSASDSLFWLDPFTRAGAVFTQRAQPAAHDLRMAAETALVGIYQDRQRARLHGDTLDYMELAALRIDLLGLKIQYTNEIASDYWEAYQNQTNRQLMGHDLTEISATNGRLQDLRDQTTRVEGKYRDLWLRENRPYYLQNVLVRYDNLALEYQQKIVWLLQRPYWQALPAPEEIGFWRLEAAKP